ncbi:MAG: antiterminator LoaP [Spirochaetales bacterium]|nr:antiterminator LoaP [Spirochaetales bacterium]
MSYYVIQVKTREEEKYIHLARKGIATLGLDIGEDLLLPRRKLITRRRGKIKETLLPLYPGYIFFQSAGIPTDIYWLFRRTPGFFRFLRGERSPEPLSGEDEKLLLHFLSFGETVETSQVFFDENNKIRVVSGPMTGLEGRIVKVDKRKKRAKVRLSLYENSFLVDFSFELMEKMAEQR